jgi:hypothetical protein
MLIHCRKKINVSVSILIKNCFVEEDGERNTVKLKKNRQKCKPKSGELSKLQAAKRKV